MSANADAEMARIHDLYQGTKSELAQRTQQEVQRHHAHERALSQMQALQLELRDKLRFTELQLAGAREEGASLAATGGCVTRVLGVCPYVEHRHLGGHGFRYGDRKAYGRRRRVHAAVNMPTTHFARRRKQSNTRSPSLSSISVRRSVPVQHNYFI